MLGSAFVQEFAAKGPVAWEAAALEIAREDGLTPWPWVDLSLADADGNTATIRVQTDVVAIGSLDDHVRLPLLPETAQSIANLSGALLPTAWLVYQMWRAATTKLEPHAMAPNRGANLFQYAEHSRIIDDQIVRATVPPLASGLVAGIKKHIVVSNLFKPAKVLIFGWYRPSPPAPDVFGDKQPMGAPDRQPIQPLSNVHGAFYVDYSHGVQLIGPTAIVNGESMDTATLYQHPILSKLVSNEGPIRTPRYPAHVPPARGAPPLVSFRGSYYVPTVPGPFETPTTYAAGVPAVATDPRRRSRRNW